MATPIPSDTLRSHVVQVRTGLLIVGMFVPAFGLMALMVGGFLLSDAKMTSGPIFLVVGLAMLGTGWSLMRRAQLPMLAVLSPTGLRLDPRDRSLTYGRQPVDYAWADLTGYSELTSDAGTQIKLYTARQQTIRLSNRPASGVPADEAALPGLVDVVTLGQEIQRRLVGTGVPAASIYRPNFYERKLGRALVWLSYGLMAWAVALLFWPGVDWMMGTRLLVFSSIYLGMYHSNQRRSAGDAAQ